MKWRTFGGDFSRSFRVPSPWIFLTASGGTLYASSIADTSGYVYTSGVQNSFVTHAVVDGEYAYYVADLGGTLTLMKVNVFTGEVEATNAIDPSYGEVDEIHYLDDVGILLETTAGLVIYDEDTLLVKEEFIVSSAGSRIGGSRVVVIRDKIVYNPAYINNNSPVVPVYLLDSNLNVQSYAEINHGLDISPLCIACGDEESSAYFSFVAEGGNILVFKIEVEGDNIVDTNFKVIGNFLAVTNILTQYDGVSLLVTVSAGAQNLIIVDKDGLSQKGTLVMASSNAAVVRDGVIALCDSAGVLMIVNTKSLAMYGISTGISNISNLLSDGENVYILQTGI